jgi:hypothetical protein
MGTSRHVTSSAFEAAEADLFECDEAETDRKVG